MKNSDFRRLMDDEFGPANAGVIASTLVLPTLDLTADDALRVVVEDPEVRRLARGVAQAAQKRQGRGDEAEAAAIGHAGGKGVAADVPGRARRLELREALLVQRGQQPVRGRDGQPRRPREVRKPGAALALRHQPHQRQRPHHRLHPVLLGHDPLARFAGSWKKIRALSRCRVARIMTARTDRRTR